MILTYLKEIKMDEMTIVSKFMTKIVSGILTKALEKQLGCKVDLHLNEMNAELRTADIMKLSSKFM